MARKINRDLKSAIYQHFDYQTDFAEAVGVSSAYVSKIINREHPLAPDQRERWASALGVSIAELDDILSGGNHSPAAAKTGAV